MTERYLDLRAEAVESAADVCACGHLVDVHDPIASRFCRATASECHDRQCICITEPQPE